MISMREEGWRLIFNINVALYKVISKELNITRREVTNCLVLV